MIRVLVVADDFSDGCAWYRSVGPWTALARQGVPVTLKLDPNFVDVKMHDVVYLQRPSSERAERTIKAAKDFGVKVWVDFDDDLFCVPADNRAHERYRGPVLHGIERFIRKADVVTTSTKHLENKFLENQWNTWVETVPNALEDEFVKLKDAHESLDIVMWRGTDTHNRDVGTYATAIVEAANKYPDYKFAFVGCDPVSWMVSEQMTNVIRVTMPMTPVTLYRTMITLAPKVLMVPLADHPFNRAKSNVAMIEGALAGAAVLAPDWPEWQCDGVTPYKNVTDFRERLEGLMSGKLNAFRHASDTWSFVKEKLLLSKVNQKRVEILNRLSGG